MKKQTHRNRREGKIRVHLLFAFCCLSLFFSSIGSSEATELVEMDAIMTAPNTILCLLIAVLYAAIVFLTLAPE